MNQHLTASAPTLAAPAPAINVRKIKVPFPSDLPRHWLAGNSFATHLANSVNLLFPAGERYFVRSVNHYKDHFADDPELGARIRGFFGQEGNHAREHERFFATLEEQGFRIRGFLRVFEWFNFRLLERISPAALRLSGTAATEHFTAVLAEQALTDDLLDNAHPIMQHLFKWHAAEEIEHKAVAFDVLQAVNPSYPLRVAGMGMASSMLALWWLTAVIMFLIQDRIGPITLLRQMRAMKATRRQAGKPDRSIVHGVFVAGIREYLGKSFHPDNKDNYHLAQAYLQSMDQGDAPAAASQGAAR